MHSTDQMLALLDQGDFRTLFIEHLGWSKPKGGHLNIPIDDTTYDLEPIAEYHGIKVWACNTVPDRRTQRLIDVALRREGTERLTIFHDSVHQEWKWPMSGDAHGRGQGRLVTHEHFVGKRTEALLQRLSQITIGMDESPSVVEIVARLRKAFDADRMTAAFYTKFSKQAEDLAKSIRGLSVVADREWYAALLMNRLMFIYFMQRKGFMDGQSDYLADRLRSIRAAKGEDKFYEFYTDFLIPLFHDGLGSSQRPLTDAGMAALVGDVPYVNGGIFSVHPLERDHKIGIPDRAFEEIFELFDAYQWHLDDRPTGNPSEINPDVLGYIFEQFINNKEQGAYYTKDDVTYFMTSSTLLPAYLDRLIAATGVNPWIHVTADPNRYIWDGLTYGTDEPLPKDVADSADEPWPRNGWSHQASETCGLPGETWWEVDHRRKALDHVRQALANGQVASVDSAITKNIDLESLVVDTIDRLDSPDDVITAWQALTDIKIVDPTCGSGAFLFAALKILEVVYSVILDAAERHAATASNHEIDALLDRVRSHPSRTHFVLKHATLNNLYGVDIMKEAVEIARLRLFLKLVSAAESRDRLEPLPDLDFNIKPGNILVGSYSVDAIEQDSDDLLSGSTADAVTEAAKRIADDYRAFRAASETGDNDAIAGRKERLLSALDQTRAIVDAQYHAANGGRAGGLEKWRTTHQPFHWFIEFPEVFANGGFDVVLGNPPYVSRTKVKDYTYRGFRTDHLSDIYAPCVERATQITNPNGRFAMILPISVQFADGFQEARGVLEDAYPGLWVSAFSRNPAALFSAGLGVRSTIVIGTRTGDAGLFVTKTHRWYDEYRPALFETLHYLKLPDSLRAEGWLRPTSEGLAEIMVTALAEPGSIGTAVRPWDGGSVGFKQTSLYWLSVFPEDPPCFELDGRIAEQTKIGRLKFGSEEEALLATAVLASKFAFVWWYCSGDDFDVTQDGLRRTPIDPTRLSAETKRSLIKSALAMIADFPNHVMFTKYAGKWMGNYVHSEMRDITDRIDLALAKELGYVDLLPALEHAYYCVYKPTGDRPGTLRESPFSD